MKRAMALLVLFGLPVAAQEYKIAVVSMLHAHVWLHLGTMLKGDKVKLVGVSETRPELIASAKRTDQIPQSQNTRPGVPESMIFARLEEDDRRNQTGHRLGVHSHQRACRRGSLLRAPRHSRHGGEADGCNAERGA